MELRDRSCISGHHFSSWLTILVAVGTGVASCPPRRSRHAAFPHQAPVEGQTRPAFGAWAAHPGPVRGRWPSGTCGFRLCVRGMRWPLPFLQPFPPRSPPPTRRPVLFEASSVLCGALGQKPWHGFERNYLWRLKDPLILYDGKGFGDHARLL